MPSSRPATQEQQQQQQPYSGLAAIHAPALLHARGINSAPPAGAA
jgi:hypothetical protein